MINLDFECAKAGAALAGALPKKDGEDVVRKCLAVLQENGVYACFIYAFSLKEGKGGKKVIGQMAGLLKDQNLIADAGIIADNVNIKLKDVFGDLDKLFLAKLLMENTLIYALYHIRATPGANSTKGEEVK